MSPRKVVRTAAQHRVDQLSGRSTGCDWWRRNTSLSLRWQPSSLFELGRVVGAPYAPQATRSAEVQTPESLSSRLPWRVLDRALFFVDFDTAARPVPPAAVSPPPPISRGVSLVGVDPPRQVVSKILRVFDGGVLAASAWPPSPSPASMSTSVRSRDVAEQRRNHPTAAPGTRRRRHPPNFQA